jgi:hypothetical protein
VEKLTLGANFLKVYVFTPDLVYIIRLWFSRKLVCFLVYTHLSSVFFCLL